MQKKVPDYVMKILSSLETGGYPAYLAGGCVRDLFMSKTPSDWDVATAATPDIVSGLFDKTFHTGRKYGTVTVVVGRNAVEVTTFRSESGYLKHRWPENVVFSDDLHADLSRRDFTVNAIAMSARGEITDLFCGREDIRNKVIRCVGDPAERFSEDALRMFRALRFSAVLGFSIERETGEAIAQNAGLAAEISAERISAEVEKIIMSDRPETMERLISYGLLDKYLDGKGRGARGMDKISSLPASRGYRWTAYAALLLNLGCVTNPRAHLHSMRLDRKLIKNCAIAANLSQNPLPRDRIGMKMQIARHGTEIAGMAAAAGAMLHGGDGFDLFEDIVKSNECCTLSQLAITGENLMPLGFSGRNIGNALDLLLRHVISRPEDNVKTLLLEIAARERDNYHI